MMGLTDDELLALKPAAKVGLTDEQLLSLGKKNEPSKSPPSATEDIAKSAGSGLASGVLGMADMANKLSPIEMAKGIYDVGKAGYEGGITAAGKKLWENATSQPYTDVADQVTGGVTKYEPQSTTGKYAKTVAEFVPGLIGGGEGLIPKGMGIVKRLATGVVAPGVASEAAGQYAEKNNFDPRIQQALRIAGGLAGGALGSLADLGSGEIKAAKALTSQSTDAEKAAAAIGEKTAGKAIGENIKGSVPDTAEVTGDVGLAHARKRMLMDPEFNQAVGENQAAQNAARQKALEGIVPEANPLALEEQLATKRANAEQIAASAESEAAKKASMIPSSKHPEDLGTNLRSSLATAKEAAKEAVNAAFAKVDPNRRIVMVTSPIKEAAKEAIKDFVPGVSTPLSSGEARILDAVGSSPETMPFWHLKALRENVNSAIDDSLGEFGKATPETRRLQIIKGGIDDAINNAAKHQENYIPSEGYTGLTPNLTPDTYSALKTANKMYGDYSDKFVSGPVGHALQTAGSDFKNSNASVTKNAFSSGPEGFERTNKFIATTPESLSHLKEMAVTKFQELAGDKPITPDLVKKWREKYDGSIRAIEAHDPTFAKTIDEAAGSYSTASELREHAKAQTVLGVHGPDAMRNTVGKALDSKDGGKSVKQIIDLASGNKEAIAGIKRAGVEHLIEKFSNAGMLGGERVLSGAKLGKYVKLNQDSIRELIGDDGLKTMQTIASDIERSQVAIENARVRTGGSDTAFMLGKDVKNINDKASGMIQSAANTALGTGLGYVHPAIGIAVGAVGWVGKLIGKVGQENTNRIIKEALLDPAKAKSLLELGAKGRTHLPTWIASLMNSINAGRQQRASGGQVSINHEYEADKLIKAAEASKAKLSQTTEPLLNQPDEHIVKALGIANEAI